MSENSLRDLMDRWNQGDESALLEIYDRWGERILRAVYHNSRVARGAAIYGSSDMRQTVLRWMLMYARSRRIYATRPEHVEALFRTFVKRAVIRADRKLRESTSLEAAMEPATNDHIVEMQIATEEQQLALKQARESLDERDWHAAELISRDVPQATIAEMEGTSYQYFRLRLARKRRAARKERVE